MKEFNSLKDKKELEELWEGSKVSIDLTHHILNGDPMYGERFEEVLSFHPPGLAPAKKDHKWFHIDAHGRSVYTEKYDRVWGYYENLATVSNNGVYYHIDPKGNPAYSNRFLWCGNFQDNRCSVQYSDLRFGHILADGKKAYEQTYRYAGDFRESYAVVQLDNGMHVHIDEYGKRLNEKEFIDLTPFHKGISCARDSAGWFHIDKNGDGLYDVRYEYIEPFYNGHARVITRYGEISIIDEDGSTLSTVREQMETPLQALSNKMVGFWNTELLFTISKMGIMDILPATSKKVSERLNLEESKVERIMRALWEVNLVSKEDNIWKTTMEGSLFRSDSSYNAKAAIWNWREFHKKPWENLSSALFNGDKQNSEDSGKKFFGSIEKNLQNLKIYQEAMAFYALHDYSQISNLIRINGDEIIADAGGGYGILLCLLKQKFPNIRTMLFDTPGVINLARKNNTNCKLEFVEGNIFASFPFKANVIFLCRVLHDWNDKSAHIILKNARNALLEGGSIYIVDRLLNSDSQNGGMLDMNMLCTTGGKERSLEELRDILENSGFKISNLTPNSRFGFLIEARMGE